MELKSGVIIMESKINISMAGDKICLDCGNKKFYVAGDIEQISVLKEALDEAYKLGYSNCGSELMPKLMDSKEKENNN